MTAIAGISKVATIAAIAILNIGCVYAFIKYFRNCSQPNLSTPPSPDQSRPQPTASDTSFTQIQNEIIRWHSTIKNDWKTLTITEFEKLIRQGETLGCLNLPPPLPVGPNPNTIPILLEIAMTAALDFSEQARILIAAGADLKIKCRMGNTPLIWAIANARNGFAAALIEYGQGHDFIDVISQVDNAAEDDRQFPGWGNGALHLAVAKGYLNLSRDKEILTVSNVQLVKNMLAKGCWVDILDKENNTPLHYACMRRDFQMIQALLKYKANRHIKNLAGELPIELLELDFERAKKRLNGKVSSAFYLDKEEYEKNLAPCIKLLDSTPLH